MKSHKSKEPPQQDWVWRISEASPLGEWVDRSAPPPTIALAKPAPPQLTDLPEVRTGGWLVSSYDLLSGTEIDDAEDSVPMELFDELFPPRPPGEDEPGK